MSTAAAAPPPPAAAEGSSTSSASPNQAPVAPSDSPATFQTAPAEPPSSTGADSDDLLATLGAPLGTGSSGSAAEHELAPTPAAAAAAEPTTDESPSTTPATKVEPASAPTSEATPATTALPTTTTSTTTAAAAPEASKAAAGPTAAAPAAGASSSSPSGPTRQAASTAAAQPARGGKKKKKGTLASLLASVFFCFPSDDGAYDGAKKPAAAGANGPPRAPAGADQASSAAKKASKESSATSSAGEKKAAGGEPLRQITSRELMAVDTTAAAGKDAEKTPKPPALALPVPTTPLNTKRSASNLEAGGDVVIPPPTPTSPPIDEVRCGLLPRLPAARWGPARWENCRTSIRVLVLTSLPLPSLADRRPDILGRRSSRLRHAHPLAPPSLPDIVARTDADVVAQARRGRPGDGRRRVVLGDRL